MAESHIAGRVSGFFSGFQKNNRLGANGFATADRAYALACLGFDAYLTWIDAERPGYFNAHSLDIRFELRSLKFDCRIYVDNSVSGFVKRPADVAKEQKARSISPARRCVGKVLPDVAQRRCPQEGVANGMGERVAIGMSDRSQLEGNRDSAQYQLPPGSQAMHIVADSHSEGTYAGWRRGLFHVLPPFELGSSVGHPEDSACSRSWAT